MSKKKKGNSSTSLVIKTSKKGKDFSIPDGMYSVKVAAIEIADGKFGEQIQWDFKIIKGKQKGKQIRMWSPVDANPKNKSGKAIKAISNKRLKDGKIDLEKMIDRKCKIVVENSKNESGDKRSKVISVLPYDLDED